MRTIDLNNFETLMHSPWLNSEHIWLLLLIYLRNRIKRSDSIKGLGIN